jgi:ComF family protein
VDSLVVCSGCLHSTARYTRARSWGSYEGNLRRVIQSFKFEGLERLATPLSEFLTQCYVQHFSEIDWIVPVPLHPRRTRQRGFDQTLILAKSLSTRVGIPLLRCIRRSRYTAPQFGLDHVRRRQNVRGAFEVMKRSELEGRSVLLVDDVMTTGATVEEISGVLLRDSEPKEVQVLTVARVSKIVL